MKSFLPHSLILCSPFVTHGNNEPDTICLVYASHIAIFQIHSKYSFLYLCSLTLNPRTKYVLVFLSLQVFYIFLGKQTCIGYNYGMVESVSPGQVLYHRYKRLALVYIPFVNSVAYWIAARGDKQAKENLRTRMLAVLRETGLAEVVFLRSLEVKSSHIIEHYAYFAATYFLCVSIGYAFHIVLYIITARLDNFAGSVLLAVLVFSEAKVVKELVYGFHVVVFVQILSEILHRAEFAARIE